MSTPTDGPHIVGWEVSEDLYADMKGDCYRDWRLYVAMPDGVVHTLIMAVGEACPGLDDLTVEVRM